MWTELGLSLVFLVSFATLNVMIWFHGQLLFFQPGFQITWSLMIILGLTVLSYLTFCGYLVKNRLARCKEFMSWKVAESKYEILKRLHKKYELELGVDDLKRELLTHHACLLRADDEHDRVVFFQTREELVKYLETKGEEYMMVLFLATLEALEIYLLIEYPTMQAWYFYMTAALLTQVLSNGFFMLSVLRRSLHNS